MMPKSAEVYGELTRIINPAEIDTVVGFSQTAPAAHILETMGRSQLHTFSSNPSQNPLDDKARGPNSLTSNGF
jgi:hypothetical protein